MEGKEQDAQVEAARKEEVAAQGLEDGEHVADMEGKDGDAMKLDGMEVGKEEGEKEGLVAGVPAVMGDIEKKRKRAERFGTDLKISEAEKRKLRAARFNDGTKNGGAVAPAVVVVEGGKGDVAKVSESVKSALMEAESAKRKARAERFGSTQPEAVLTPKFSPKSDVSPKPKFSQDEEAKKKARMARFAMAAK